MPPASVLSGARVCLWLSAALTACSATTPPPHPNWSAAESAAERRCQAGDVTGCGDAGRSLLFADRSRREVERALVLLEGACGGGYLPACVTLSDWYEQSPDRTSQARAQDLLTRATP